MLSEATELEESRAAQQIAASFSPSSSTGKAKAKSPVVAVSRILPGVKLSFVLGQISLDLLRVDDEDVSEEVLSCAAQLNVLSICTARVIYEIISRYAFTHVFAYEAYLYR